MSDEADKLSRVRAQRIPAPLHLGPVPEASAQARRFVRDALELLGADPLIESAELGVSELVSNACLHARTAITVTLKVESSGAVRIEVSDDSPRPPVEQQLGPMATTGRGMRLLSAYGRWGVDEAVDGRIGKTVWFTPLPATTVDAEGDEELDAWPELS